MCSHIEFILNFFLIPVYGLYGAAIGTSVCVGTLYITATIWAKYKLNLWPYDKKYLKGLIASLGTILAVYAVKDLVEVQILNLVIQGSIAIIVFSFLLLILNN